LNLLNKKTFFKLRLTIPDYSPRTVVEVSTSQFREGKMIVVVDERPIVSEAYKSSIGREGYTVASFTPDEFVSWFQSSMEIDLGAIDALLLGEFAGRISVTKDIKQRISAPTIALSDANMLDSTLKLFEVGIDDVVKKPVHAREIVARIAAIKRRGQRSKPALWDADGLVVFGGGRSPEVNGSTLQLPRRELRILEYLAANKGRRITRTQIFDSVYGIFDEEVEECVVESHISKLRKKLKAVLGHDPIDTQRFLGYQLLEKMTMAA
jgi:two-component system, OmpR family, flagellar system response regulator FtcR